MDVRRAIVARAFRGEAQLALVARDLAVSPRTLQRRLAAAGASFRDSTRNEQLPTNK
jgi:transposase-like protein